jgi:hypothetical protein
MNKHDASPDDIRRLSDDVIQTANYALKGEVTSEGWQVLITGGLMLRRLANLPPPWADEPSI